MEAGLASEGSSGSELGLVEAAKAQRRARPPPRPSPPAAATATACTADSDSDDGEPFVLAAAKKQASKAGSPSRHPRAASATAGTASPLAVKPAAQPGGLQSDSDSELDLVALAKQRSRMAHPADAAAAHGSSPARSPGAAHAASPTKPAGRRAAPAPAACEGPGPLPAPVQGGGSPLQGADEGEAEGQRAPAGGGTARRRLQKSISLAPERDQPEEQASPTAGALAEAAAPSQCSRMSTVVEHGGEPQGSALLELAAGPLPVLMEDGSPPPSQAFAFTPPHSPSRPRSRQPSGAGVAGPAAASPSRAASQGRGASGGAGAAAGSPAVPLASLADLGDVMSAAVGESSLRCGLLACG